jgi:hypothetical protein
MTCSFTGVAWSWIAGVIGLPALVAWVGPYLPTLSARITAGIPVILAMALLHWKSREWPFERRMMIDTLTIGIALSILCWGIMIVTAIVFTGLFLALGTPALD